MSPPKSCPTSTKQPRGHACPHLPAVSFPPQKTSETQARIKVYCAGLYVISQHLRVVWRLRGRRRKYGEEDPPEPPQIRTELRLPGQGLKNAIDTGCQTTCVSRGLGVKGPLLGAGRQKPSPTPSHTAPHPTLASRLLWSLTKKVQFIRLILTAAVG